jgi:hypothetical protein
MIDLKQTKEEKMSQAKIENKMEEYLVKKAPFQLPENGKKTLVNWLPYLALIFGILSVLTAAALWNTGHNANEAVRTVNEIGAAYGIESRASELGLFYYVSIIAILIEATLLIAAYPGLKNRSKSKGWNLLLYSVGVSLVYGLFVAMSAYGGLVDFLGSIAGALISLYILAQLRGYYSHKHTVKK